MKQVGAWVAVAVTILAMVFGILYSYGLLTESETQEGIGAVATIASGFETVVPLVETANAIE